MGLYYDLHAHSTASDGTLSPRELVELAAERSVDCLALTDHDTTAGYTEAVAAAAETALRLLCGAEISVSWGSHEIHIVGVDIDPDYQPLVRGLAKQQSFRHWRAEEIGRRLAKRRIDGAWEGARALAPGALVTRSHFARYLVNEGHVRGMQDAFDRLIGRGKPAFVPGEWCTLEEAIDWIGGAGGIAVIAHPARYKLTNTRLRSLIGEFIDCGGQAIEVVSGSHSRDDVLHTARLCREFGLLASTGSDFHTPDGWIAMGGLPPLPDDLTPIWSDWPD